MGYVNNKGWIGKSTIKADNSGLFGNESQKKKKFEKDGEWTLKKSL